MKTKARRQFCRLPWAMAVAFCFAGNLGPAVDAAELQSITLYDKDPQHLWNRLAAALLTGYSSPASEQLRWDLLDSPLWFSGDLHKEPVHARLLALLRDFATNGPRPETMSPLQRAIMQRDLLGAFRSIDSVVISRERTPAEREMLVALSRAIRYIALTKEEIGKLPDNYAAATEAPVATEDDPAHPRAFLPKDLLAEDGPWLGLLSDSGGLTAPAHFNALEGRSSFEVRMRLPGGRAAGLAYLKTLAEMKDPWVDNPPPGVSRAPVFRDVNGKATYFQGKGTEIGPWLNPKTPQFPPGTMWALVRRAVLATPDGQPVVSPLVESVQLRVYRTADSAREVMGAPEVVAVISAAEPFHREAVSAALYSEKVQTIFEWESRRVQMLNGGGFHLTEPEDLRFAVFPTGINLRAPQQPRLVAVANSCSSCHPGSGIHSVLSRSRRMMVSGPASFRPPEFYAAKRAELDDLTAYAVEKLSSWVLLRWLMTEP